MDEAVSDTQRNTCETSYLTADKSCGVYYIKSYSM
jgi:hypothetical protein